MKVFLFLLLITSGCTTVRYGQMQNLKALGLIPVLNNKVEMSLEGYYKTFNNVLDFKDNARILGNRTIETEVRRGKGWAYGLEVFIKKNSGKCLICKNNCHQPSFYYCQMCSYQKGICAMCGKKMHDVSNYVQSNV